MIHVLNGDAIQTAWTEARLPGHALICRECLVDGPLVAVDEPARWKLRAAWLGNAFPKAPILYQRDVQPLFQQLMGLPPAEEVVFWFENDLFCQVNFWYLLSLLPAETRAFRAFPVEVKGTNPWGGFGTNSPADLQTAFSGRVAMSPEDVQLGTALWNAFLEDDRESLAQLGNTSSKAFQQLPAVVQAQLDRQPDASGLNRIERFVLAQLQAGTSSFQEVFRAFCEQEGIYGFGDTQLEPVYQRFAKSA